MLENFIKGSNNTGPIPPVGRINGLCTDTTARSTSTLDFNDRSETASREGLLELGRDRVVRMEVGIKGGEKNTAISIPLSLGRDMAGGWREAVDIVDVAKGI
jgi:hypothetical protein